MLRKIGLENADLWDGIVNAFTKADVYYLSGYVKAFQLHGDGDPVLIHWQDGEAQGILVLMLRDIGQSNFFQEKITAGSYIDAVTPYGYGGFIFNQDLSDVAIVRFKEELFAFFEEEHIVSVFFRFHPVLKNVELARKVMPVVDLGKTISMDLVSPEQIWSDITSKNRNMIRKAEKNGVVIGHGKGKALLRTFREIYNETMKNDHADDYYYFEEDFYHSIDVDLNDNYEIFYASYDGETIAMSIMIYHHNMLNYHLSGSKREYRHLAPSNLLLYQAALWGYENGMTSFHLGGGLGSSEDSLYAFKAGFNRRSDCQFSIGKMIVNQEKYAFLTRLREADASFDSQSTFFPLYRS